MRRGIFYTTGTQLAIQAIGVGTGVLLARVLGPDGRGQLAAVISWASMLSYLGNFGLPVALLYASARYPLQRHQLLGNSALLAMGQWLLIGLVGWLVLPKALASYGPGIEHLAVLYLWAYVPLNLLTLYANAIQQGAGQYAAYNAVRLSVPFGYAILLVLVWVTGHFGVASVVLVNLLSNVLTVALALALSLPLLIRLRRDSAFGWFDSKALRRDLRYGISAQMGTLQPFSGLQIDVLALTLMAANHELGLYMAALAAANLIRAQGFALGQVVLPEVAKRKTTIEQWRIIGRFMLIAAVGGSLVSVIIVIWATPLLRLIYGQAFIGAAPMIKVLCFAGTLGAVYRILADGLRGMGRPIVSTSAELVGVVLGVIALITCIPIWGAEGAAFAVLVASAASLIVAALFALRMRGEGKIQPVNPKAILHEPR